MGSPITLMATMRQHVSYDFVGRRSMPTVGGTLIHRESRRGNFRRAFELDPLIDAGKIGARIEQGILTLTLPKAEQVKPRKIAVS